MHGTVLFAHEPDTDWADLVAAAAADALIGLVAEFAVSVQELGSHRASEGDIAHSSQSKPCKKRIEVAGQG